jgi:phosphoribosylglycinamide formyltransferase 1
VKHRRSSSDGSTVKRIVVLISGRGSNMVALLDAGLPATICAVLSNDPEARGLATARQRGIPASAIDHRRYADRAAFDAALTEAIDRHRPDLVVLAGFMRILTDAFVQRYDGRLINIHPSLLPSFPGLHPHRRALEAGVRVHGCTVHFVTSTLDHGPVVIQAAVPVLAGDTEDTLAARVLHEEHRIYPQAVRWFCEDRLRLTTDGRVIIADARSAAGTLINPPPDATGTGIA